MTPYISVLLLIAAAPSVAGSPLTCATVNCITGTTCRQINGRPQCVPNTPSPIGSPLTCAFVGCVKGFTCRQINGRPQCVPNASSSTESSLTCANVRCRDGTTCQQINGSPQCVPYIPGPPCPTIPCPPGQICRIIAVNCVQGALCPQPPPPKCVPVPLLPSISCANVRCIGGTTCQLINNRPQCVSNTTTPRMATIETTSEEYNPCAATSCPVGQECRVRQVQCVRAPCNPIGECYSPPRDDRCPQFESFRECATYCEPTCSNRNPVCIQSCAPAQCQCNQGLYRNGSGQCVTESDCAATPYKKIRL